MLFALTANAKDTWRKIVKDVVCAKCLGIMQTTAPSLAPTIRVGEEEDKEEVEVETTEVPTTSIQTS